MATNELLNLVNRFIENHPSVRARDLYKIIYQKNFGPAHILEDMKIAHENFLEEYENCTPHEGNIFESIDDTRRVFWLYLRHAKAEEIPHESIWDIVVRSGRNVVGSVDDFRIEWAKISNYLKSIEFEDSDLAELDANSQYDTPPFVNHSEEFIRVAKPSYRVVTAETIIERGGKLAEIFASERERMLQREYTRTIEATAKDVQNDRPEHAVDINRVGISNLHYPVVVLDKNRAHQETVAEITMSVDLPAKWRGTHMSRFIGVMNKYRGEITYIQIRAILEAMREEFEAEAAHFKMEFPYFIEKPAPVTGQKAFLKYEALLDGEMDRDGFQFRVGVGVPVTTLCPCSKELCDKSAHSQRAKIEISVLSPSFIWLEELIDIAEKAASASVFTLLKRPDEKFVTEKAYENPRFVEDVARQIAQQFRLRRDIAHFRVDVVSEESIHNHSAFATIEGGFGTRAFQNYYSSLGDDAYSTNF